MFQKPSLPQPFRPSVPEISRPSSGGESDEIRLELVGFSARPGNLRQTDFSILGGAVGLDWAELTLNRQVHADQVPAFTLFRFREGEYGTRVLSDGSIETGGLQQEMERVDAVLAEHFPITIHVVYVTRFDSEPYHLELPHWRGALHVHPVRLSASRARENAEQILSLMKGCDPDIVHIHGPRGDLDRIIAENIPASVGMVASNHGAPLPKECPSVPEHTLFSKLIGRYLRHRQTSGVGESLALTATDSLRFLRDKLVRCASATVLVNREALKHGHGIYEAFNLSAVSAAGQGNLESVPSVVVRPPVDPEFFPLLACKRERSRHYAPALTLGMIV